jgi:hypothetical protein
VMPTRIFIEASGSILPPENLALEKLGVP